MDTEEIEALFKSFIQSGAQNFYDGILVTASFLRFQPGASFIVEEALLNHSYIALKRAREIEEQTGGIRADDWRTMSFLCRKAAHKIFRSYNSESTHPGFLRLIK